MHPPTVLTLANGVRVVLRPLTDADREPYARAVARLSPAARRQRFFRAVRELSARELGRLINVDGIRHVALVATPLGEPARIIGEARYVRLPAGEAAAEVGAFVADEWRGQGLGRRLMALLGAGARRAGVAVLYAHVGTDNAPMLHLLRQRASTIALAEPGIYRIELPLPQEPVTLPGGQERWPLTRTPGQHSAAIQHSGVPACDTAAPARADGAGSHAIRGR